MEFVFIDTILASIWAKSRHSIILKLGFSAGQAMSGRLLFRAEVPEVHAFPIGRVPFMTTLLRCKSRPQLPTLTSLFLLAISQVFLPSMTLAQKPQREKTVTDKKLQVAGLANQILTLKGKSQLTITGTGSPIDNSLIRLNSPDAWVLFPNENPSRVNDKYLKYFTVGQAPAELDMNVRIRMLATGAVLIPHGPDYTPLQTFNQNSFRGESQAYVIHKYYRPEELDEFDNEIASFKLKQGYMATLAENKNGTGASKVFIAADQDLEVKTLPSELKGKVSFVRVFPWNWTSKKGFGGNQESSEALGSQWRYDWSAGGQSTLDMEYVPMRHNAKWDSYRKINEKENVTAVLGFNEPMQKDQSNMTIDECLKQWPKLMESGLRIGSLAPTDGGTALNYLYEFMDKADQQGLRVDFVAVHCYHGNRSPKQWVEWLRKIHVRTGRPIWVTEFNNGARWVKNHNPSLQENAKHVKGLLQAMDAAPFIERYAVFNLTDKQYHRQFFIDKKLTPAGEMYRHHKSPLAFR